MLFHFQTVIDQDAHEDDQGIELPSQEAALEMALKTLGELAHHQIPRLRNGAEISIRASDEALKTVCVARLRFTCE